MPTLSDRLSSANWTSYKTGQIKVCTRTIYDMFDYFLNGIEVGYCQRLYFVFKSEFARTRFVAMQCWNTTFSKTQGFLVKTRFKMARNINFRLSLSEKEDKSKLSYTKMRFAQFE